MNKLNQTYKLGQRLYYVNLRYKRKPCPVCKKGLIKLKDGISLTCPICHGSVNGASIGKYIVTPVKIVKITVETLSKRDSKLWRYIIRYALSNDAILSEWIDNKGDNEFSLGGTFVADDNFISCTNKKEAKKKADELTKLLTDHLNSTTKGYILV